jgi:polysaccharide export outer membrane protein
LREARASESRDPKRVGRIRPAWVIAACAILSAAPACSNVGRFVWADQYQEPPPPPEQPYVIAVGDTIQVRVFNQDQLSARVRVRPDGKVSLPLLNEVVAAGLTPLELSRVLEQRLKDLVKGPAVTVSLEETKPHTITVVGEVAKPNSYPLDVAPGVLQALAIAGGLTPDASSDRIFVLRQTPSPVRIRFTYEALVHQQPAAINFKLRSGDVVLVE